MQSCKYYLRARCNKGSACLYSHDDAVASQQDPRRLLRCAFHQKGRCFAGDGCPYSHSTSDAIKAEAQLGREPFLRIMGGGVGQFGPGGTITKLSMISNFSSVRLDGFSEADATSRKLPVLLRQLGHDLLPSETLRAVKIQGTSNATVYITSDDPEFAQRFCEEFKTTSATLHLRAVSVPPKFPPGTITRHTSCRKIEISWSRPTRAVWIRFDTYADAAVVGGRFNREVYTIAGLAVEAGAPTSYDNKWQILLRNAPFDITEARIRSAMHPPPEVPFHIKLGKARESFDEEVAPAFIASLFNSVGSVDYMTEPRKQGRYCTAAIHFEHEIDAQTAVAQFHNQPQQFLAQGKLTVRLMCTSKIKVPRKIYDAIHEQIDAALTSSAKHKLSLKVYPDSNPENRFVTLSLRGEDRGKVAILTGTIERMLVGKTISLDNDIFATLVEDNTVARKLKDIQNSNQVLLVTKKAKKELLFFGPPARYKMVQQAVLDLGTAPAKSKFTYQLSKTEFVWASEGGFDQIASALGDDVASLNVDSSPKSIIVNGSKAQYQQARSILQTLGGVTALEKMTLASPQHEEMCSICWTPAEDPVTLVCGHLYCAECLEDLCKSSSSDSADFSVTCKGASDTCKRVLPLSELEHHLSSKAFEDTLRISFASYIRRRANIYHYCPTPDCGFFYTCDDAATAAISTSTCLNCSEITCMSCHAQHAAMSCADFKYKRDGGDEAFNRYKEESGGKDCPKCHTHIEKTDGCNHMICGGCNGHICWVCLDMFDKSSECYNHLTAKHGGFGIEVPEVEVDAHVELELQHFRRQLLRDGINDRDGNAIRDYAQARHAQGHWVPLHILQFFDLVV